MAGVFHECRQGRPRSCLLSSGAGLWQVHPPGPMLQTSSKFAGHSISSPPCTGFSHGASLAEPRPLFPMSGHLRRGPGRGTAPPCPGSLRQRLTGTAPISSATPCVCRHLHENSASRLAFHQPMARYSRHQPLSPMAYLLLQYLHADHPAPCPGLYNATAPPWPRKLIPVRSTPPC